MNIFLVEDERWALAELIELFKVYEPSHKIFAFENGEDAISAANITVPQLVLTDINMPGIDGLELISELNKADSTIKGIILSVHDQFAYAQKGMKIGVIDYLLKPVKKDVLYKTVDKAIQNIENDSKQLEERINWSVTQMLFAATMQDNEIAASIFQRKYGMALLLLENWAASKSWRETGITDREIKQHFLSGYVQEHEIHCISIDSQRKAILVPADDDSRCPSIKTGLTSLFRHLNERHICVHISYILKKEKENANKCFTFLNKQLEEHRKLGVSTFIGPETKAEDADVGGVWGKVRVLQTLLKKGDILKGKETVDKLLLELQKKEITVRQLMLFMNDLFYSLKYNLQSSSKTEINISKLQEDIKVLNEISGYPELSEWLVSQTFSLFSESGSKDLKPKGLVPILLNWIHTNYQNDLSLQQFAGDNHVSLGYLSRLFKSQTGSTFSDYVIRYRVGKAKELLEGGVERLSDVCGLVGYEDPKHFSLLFKKIVGEPPNAYAKRMNANQSR